MLNAHSPYLQILLLVLLTLCTNAAYAAGANKPVIPHNSDQSSSSSSGHGINRHSSSEPVSTKVETTPTRTMQVLQQLGAWWAQPKQQLQVLPLLPHARPQQPWPYRQLDSAAAASITVTKSYALQAFVSHAPLPGVTSEIMAWWMANMEGDAPYAGDGQVWSKYLQWHPRDHIHQSSLTPTPGSSDSPPGTLWEICEFFICPEHGGYTRTNYQPGPQHDGDYVIREVTQLQHLGSHSMSLTVPTRWGIGSSLWQLQHQWQDSPQGLLVNSSQVVGVVDPGWRPLWYARWRNALVQGLFGRGRDPGWMLRQWLQHCVEEIGNLPHILPSLFAAAAAAGSTPVQHQDPGMQQPAADPLMWQADEL